MKIEIIPFNVWSSKKNDACQDDDNGVESKIRDTCSDTTGKTYLITRKGSSNMISNTIPSNKVLSSLQKLISSCSPSYSSVISTPGDHMKNLYTSSRELMYEEDTLVLCDPPNEFMSRVDLKVVDREVISMGLEIMNSVIAPLLMTKRIDIHTGHILMQSLDCYGRYITLIIRMLYNDLIDNTSSDDMDDGRADISKEWHVNTISKSLEGVKHILHLYESGRKVKTDKHILADLVVALMSVVCTSSAFDKLKTETQLANNLLQALAHIILNEEASISDLVIYSLPNIVVNTRKVTSSSLGTNLHLPFVIRDLLGFIPEDYWSSHNDVVGNILPMLFPIIDDLRPKVCSVGLQSVQIVLIGLSPSEVQWHGGILLQVLYRCMSSSYIEVLELILPLLSDVVFDIQGTTNKTLVDTTCDFMERLIHDSALCYETGKKKIYATCLEDVILRLGIHAVRYYRTLLPVLVSLATSMDVSLSISGLRCLLEYIHASDLHLVKYHKKAYLSGAMRAYVMSLNPEVISERNQEQEMLSMDIIKLVYAVDPDWILNMIQVFGEQVPIVNNLKRHICK